MSVRRENGWWTVQFRAACPVTGRPVRPHERPAKNTRAAALKLEKELRRRVAEGKWFQPDAVRWDGYAKRFASWAESALKESTSNGYLSIYKNHLKRWDKMDLAEIRTWHVEELRMELAAKGRTKKTINNVMACIASMFRVAREWELVTDTPMVKLHKLPPLRKRKYRFLSEEEAGSLITGCRLPITRAMVTVAIHTGLRLGELRVLRWEDVDFKSGAIHLRQALARGCKKVDVPKGGEGRDVPLSPTARRVLKAWPRKVGEELVWSTRTGRPLETGQLGKDLHEACARAGVKQCGWHVLRHTCGTWLAARGIPARTIQEWLGHSTIQMTERYMHAVPSTMREAAEVLG